MDFSIKSKSYFSWSYPTVARQLYQSIAKHLGRLLYCCCSGTWALVDTALRIASALQHTSTPCCLHRKRTGVLHLLRSSSPLLPHAMRAFIPVVPPKFWSTLSDVTSRTSRSNDSILAKRILKSLFLNRANQTSLILLVHKDLTSKMVL